MTSYAPTTDIAIGAYFRRPFSCTLMSAERWWEVSAQVLRRNKRRCLVPRQEFLPQPFRDTRGGGAHGDSPDKGRIRNSRVTDGRGEEITARTSYPEPQHILILKMGGRERGYSRDTVREQGHETTTSARIFLGCWNRILPPTHLV